MKKVTIKVIGGVISDIESSPGVDVTVQDYDTEHTEEDRISQDDSGQDCVISFYEFPEDE